MLETTSTVLLLGEESYNRKVLENNLCQRGYQIIKASSGCEGERALASKPGIVVVDQRLRGTSGLAWIRQLRESGYTMPVVFCSASSCSTKTFNELRNFLDVSLIVHKPLQPQMLIYQMECLLSVSTSGSSDAAPAEDILHFSPPLESEQEPWLREYNAEVDTRRALDLLGRAYLSEMPGHLKKLRQQITAAVLDENVHELVEAAAATVHQIKGTAGSLGFAGLSKLAGEIEQNLETFKSDGTSADRQTVTQALSNVGEMEAWLEDWLESWHKDEQEWLDVDPAGQRQELARETPEAIFIEPVPSDAICPGEQHLDQLAEDPQVIDSLLIDSIKASLESAVPSIPPIYIVDNDAGRAESLVNVLLANGNWQTETMTGGVGVLAAMEDCQPQLLILDDEQDCYNNANKDDKATGDSAKKRKGLSGFDLCRMIRCHPQWASLPIIIMTADTSIETRRALYSSGANDFIVKPLVEEELAYRLKALLSKDSKAN